MNDALGPVSPDESWLADRLSPYVPAAVKRQLVVSPAPPTYPTLERLQAALMLVDISGFTRLTEKLARQGDRGAELVQEVLNLCFGRLIDIIDRYGGEVVKFPGDAAITLWPAGETAPATAAWAAAACGLAIQQELAELDAGGNRLQFRIGIGAGPVWHACIGGVGGSWESLLGGEPLAEAAAAKLQAQPGEVVLSPRVQALVGAAAQGDVLPRGELRLARMAPLPRSAAERSPALRLAEAEAGLRAFVPPSVLSRLEAGQGALLSEFRRVTTMFVGIQEGDGAPPEELGRLQDLAVCLQAVLARFGGALNQLVVDDKGMVLLAGWGVPLHTHEDDASRAVLAAQEIRDQLSVRGFRTAIGLATGRIFTGPRGDHRRREYAMIGDPVNLAARLMEAAPGKAPAGLLCDDATRSAAARQILFDALPPLRLKGKAEPAPIFAPLRAVRHTPEAPEALGRRVELEVLAGEVASLAGGGPGGLVVLEADPGMGKSLLVAHLLALARERRIESLVVSGVALEQSSAYHSWLQPLGKLLDLQAPGLAERLRALLAGEPELAAWASLLNAVLPVTLAPNPAAGDMPPEARAEITRDLLAHLVQAATAGAPVLLVLEDAHWLDSASWKLAETLNRQRRGLLLVIATRPFEGDDTPAEYLRLAHLPGCRRLVLGPLAPADSLALACARLGVSSLPLAVAASIRERSEGHPFLVEELALSLRDRGLLRIEGGQCRLVGTVDAADFPATVQGAIASRIDRLLQAHQLTLKTASVVGRSFGVPLLAGIHPLALGEPEIRAQLEELLQLDLLRPGEEGEPGALYRFKHALTQEVAYNLLPYAQRRQLHGAVAAVLERAHGDDPAFAALLAHHFRGAGAAERARSYFLAAGNRALAGFGNREAIRFLLAARELAPPGPPPDPAGLRERAGLELRLGRAYVGASDYTAGEPHFTAGLGLLDTPMPARQLSLAGGVLAQAARQMAHRVSPSRFLGRAAGRRDRLLEAAAAYESLVELYYYTHQPLRSFYSALTTLNLSEAAGTSVELARSYALAGSMMGFIPLHRLAHFYCRRAAEIAAVTGDMSALAWVGVVTGVYYTGIGDWRRAGESYEAAVRLARTVGDERRWSDAAGNLADVYAFQGQFAEAHRRLGELEASTERRGDTRYLLAVIRAQAFYLLLQGRSAEAAGRLSRARDLSAQEPPAERELVELDLLALDGVLRLREGDDPGAWQAVGAALARLARMSEHATFYRSVLACAAVAEVCLELWEREAGPGPSARLGVRLQDELRWAAREAGGYLWRLARVFPIARPVAWLSQGGYDQLRGRPARARRAWRRAAREADRRGMPYYRGRAQLDVGRHAPAGDPARGEHLLRAAEALEPLAAAHELERLRALEPS